jgi:flavin-dependent dehydrogenase
MTDRPRSAVVLGASMTGLLAARVLSRHFDEVIIVERDTLLDEAAVRKGVPQGAHAHALLASGYRILDTYFPGMVAELEAAGAPCGDIAGDFLWFQYGRWKLRYASGLRGMVVSRPYLELAVRRQVATLGNVAILHAEAVGPIFDATQGKVTGVTVRRRRHEVGTEALGAALVIDATGRGSHSPRWLEQWGFGQTQEISVRVDAGYATRIFERRSGELFNSYGAIIAATPPAGKRTAGLMAVEGNRWIVSLGGMVGDYPPTDEEGWISFAASLPVSAVYDLVTSARPLTGIESYRFPANRRRLYEQMRQFPAGFLVVGDAMCSFNPIYGQGMTVAAIEAQALDEALESGLEHLAPRFYAKASKIVDIPWSIATGEDFRFPQVEGRRPPGTGILNRYLERVHAVASEDPAVCRRFFDVINLLAPPPALLSPAIAWRVLGRTVPNGQGSPFRTT